MKDSKLAQFWNFFIDNYKFSFVLILTIIAIGVFSVMNIPIESEPEVDIPVAVVSTPYPGASPAEVERLVTDPIEDQIKASVDGIEEITSQSRSGSSLITVQFQPDVDKQTKIFEIKDEVDRAAPDLPDQVEDSLVESVSFADVPILTLSFSGPYDKEILSRYSDDLQEQLEQVEGVSEVQIFGNLNREIQVQVQPKQLNQYNLSLAQVRQAIVDSDVNFPLGSIQTSRQNFSLQFSGSLDSAQEVAEIPIINKNDSIVKLKEIANIQDGYSNINSISRFSKQGNQPETAITVRVFKNSEADIVRTINRTQSEIDEYKQQQNLDNITITAVENRADQIRSDIEELAISGAQTVLIVALILLIVFGLREAILASIAIPLTFLITFASLYFLGFTLNVLTLFSLILSLGILVDSAVVITESIYSKQSEGKKAYNAATEAVAEFQYPLLAGVMTTVLAFLPMLLTSGIIGEFIQGIPITVGISLFASLFIALAVITTLTVVYTKKRGRKTSKENKTLKQIRGKLNKFTTGYERYLKKFIESSKKRIMLAVTLVALFIFSIALPVLGLLPVNMFPGSNVDTFTIDVTLPNGSLLEQTDQTLGKIEQKLIEDKRIKNFQTNIGSSGQTGSVTQGLGSVNNSNLGNIVVQLKENREKTSRQIIDEYEQKLSDIKAEVSITQQGSGPGESAPVEIEITGESLAQLDQIARNISSELSQIEGARNIETSIETTNGEFEVLINRSRAKLYGISPIQISQTLRARIANLDTTVIRSTDEDIDIQLELLDGKERQLFEYGAREVGISELKNLQLSTNKGKIPLSSIAEINLTGSRQQIEHLDGERVMRVTAYTQEGTTAQQIFNKMEGRIEQLDIPTNYQVNMGGEREDIQESFSDMFRAFGLAVFLITGLLVLQFNSFRQPLMILVTIPLALIGVMPGLWIMGQTLSFPGLIGIVALAGIAVNNAIILIDKINSYRKDGYTMDRAVVEAVSSRSRPVILTTITTVGGILPLALSNPTWGPLGYAIVFGLSFSTITTLIVIPLLYRKFAQKDLEGAYIS
jgi:HAE1 family hydrophobic/amphiphilic exporter-1